MSCRVARLLCASLLLSSAAAVAQDVASDPPAHISWVEGSAVLERDGQPDAAPANMPLLAGDRVRTSAGRVEILFTDGSTLHLDEQTTVDFQSDDLVRLLEGRVRLSIPGRTQGVRYRIDTPSGAATIESAGEYRVSLIQDRGEPGTELGVIRGAAVLSSDGGETPLRAGERALARTATAPSYAYSFNSAAWDDFDRWSEARRDQRLGSAGQYLPQEVRPYAASLADAGAWRYETSYGYVWYPTVSSGWRPYSQGRWVSLRPYGWTWVGINRWDWPTHHYGRWGLSAGAWFWIPGRSWAPAYVSWAYSPGYVSWCPLGWNNRPVVQVVNVYGGGGYDRWRAWTAVPERRFGGGNDVRRVMAREVELRGARPFVERDRGPDERAYAVPRGDSPIRIAGTAAGQPARSAVAPNPSRAPVYTNLEPGRSRVGSAAPRTMIASPRYAPAPDRGGARAPASPSEPARVPGRAADTAIPREGGGVLSRSPDPAYDTRIRSTAPSAAAPAPAPGRERWRGAPPDIGTPGTQGRAVPRELPAYRSPAPEPRAVTPIESRPPAPAAGMPARAPYSAPDYTPRAPERRAPDGPAEPVGRAVPRGGGVDRPSPGAAAPSGGDRRGSDRPSAGGSEGGRSRGGGRGR